MGGLGFTMRGRDREDVYISDGDRLSLTEPWVEDIEEIRSGSIGVSVTGSTEAMSLDSRPLRLDETVFKSSFLAELLCIPSKVPKLDLLEILVEISDGLMGLS